MNITVMTFAVTGPMLGRMDIRNTLSPLLKFAAAAFVGLSTTATFAAASPAGAPAIEAGNQALQLWNAEGVANSPQWVRVWLQIMSVSFLLALVFVWKRVEARWVFGGILVSLLVGRFVVPILGLLPLSGLIALIHVIFWTPGLYLLIKNRPFAKPAETLFGKLYRIWTGWILLVILFSFIFDIRDTVIYLDYMAGTGIF